MPSFQSTPIAAPGELLGHLKAALEGYIGIYSDPTGKVCNDGTTHLVDMQHRREVTVGGVHFRYFRVPHVTGGVIDKAAFGLEITQGDKKVFWSGDTTFEPRWIRDAAATNGTVRIFHECSFMPRFSGTVHTHWEELLTLPDDVLGRVTLMHHTRVPTGADISGCAGAADRHQIFIL